MDRASQRFTQRIKEFAERYAFRKMGYKI